MAKIGFEYIVAAKLDAELSKSLQTAKYSDMREIGPGASVTGTPSSSDVKDYGDDRVVETDVSVTGGTLNLELNEPTQENEAWLLGHAYSADSGVVRNTGDIPPYVGIGFVGKSMKNHKTVFKAKVYLKTQFKEPSEEYQTRQDNTTFNHTTLEGNMFQLENGDWKSDNEFTTLDDAKKFIHAILADSASVPAQTQSMGEANRGVKVSDLVDGDAAIKWDGTKGTATGNAKKNPESVKVLYGESEKTGHFFPVEFGEKYFGKKIKLSGRTGGDKTITPSKDDPYLIIRLENLDEGNTLTAIVEETGEVVFVIDFSGVTKAGE